MPFGVSKDFLTLAGQGKKSALRALGPAIGLGLLGAFVAEMLDASRLGGFVLLYLLGIVLGVGLGAAVGHLETRSWGESLKASWSGWMHASVGAGTIGEAAKRAGALHVSPWRVLTVSLAVLNFTCLVAAWFTLPPLTVAEPYGILAVGTVLVSGAAVGSFLAVRVAEGWWCRGVEQQTLDLVQQGRLGVWGIR